MRFVAGWGAAAKLQTSLGAAAKSHREVVAGLGAGTELLLAWALQRRAIGKMLLTGAAAELLTGWGAVAKLLAGAPWRRGRQGTPATQKSQLRQTELALLKPLVVSKRNNL